ncbi:Uncharacterised protein [Vibrio cholerae]|uniref:Uncharacterized protein n=1 Tax=Vibrio cholerae TaxID=666 RepID=A0A655QLI0_VIBCL|nr:Uncharacterised protein [Vibrio cholerae]CSA63487.1 Uncharacterised protein [Vibrio cholerae]CSC17860.1 Uncharacterised protein [Vibrio cholerae]
MQPLAFLKRGNITELQELIRARFHHKGKTALSMLIKVNDHSGSAMYGVEMQVLAIHLLVSECLLHKSAKGIVPDSTKKSTATG